MPISAEAHAERRRAKAPPFPRPRGRGPPGCRWDVQVGGWWRADGTSWVKVRNEKRKREGEAKMVAWKDELARRKAAREDAGKENQHFLSRNESMIKVRLQRQAELDDCIDAVRHDARTVYCEHVRKMGMLEAGEAKQLDRDLLEPKLLTEGSCRFCNRWWADESYADRCGPACPARKACPACPALSALPATCPQVCLFPGWLLPEAHVA